MLERVAHHYVGIKRGSERKYRILAEAQRKGQRIGDYVNPEGIGAYIEDEMFYEAVKDSYKSIDLTGTRKRDLERFIAKRDKAAAWLRQKANGIYF